MTRKALQYLIAAYAWSWCSWAVVLGRSESAARSRTSQGLILLGTFGPLVASMALVWREAGWSGVRGFFRRGIQWRVPGWTLFAAVAVPAAVAAASNWLAGGPAATVRVSELIPAFVVYLFLGGSFAEEFGWRGFLWPELRGRFGLVRSAATVGLVWSLWHLPLFFIAGTTQRDTPLLAFTLGCIGMSLWMGRMSDSSGASVLPALLFHTTWNVTTLVFPPFTRQGQDPTAYPSALLFLGLALLLGWGHAIRALRVAPDRRLP